MIDGVIKILSLCLVAGALSLTVKSKAQEYAFMISLAVGIVILLFVTKAIYEPIATLTEKLNDYGVETEYFKVALKAVGLSLITEFIADACRDSGQGSLANKAELAGKTACFLLSVPLLISILDTAVSFIK